MHEGYRHGMGNTLSGCDFMKSLIEGKRKSSVGREKARQLYSLFLKFQKEVEPDREMDAPEEKDVLGLLTVAYLKNGGLHGFTVGGLPQEVRLWYKILFLLNAVPPEELLEIIKISLEKSIEAHSRPHYIT